MIAPVAFRWSATTNADYIIARQAFFMRGLSQTFLQRIAGSAQ